MSIRLNKDGSIGVAMMYCPICMSESGVAVGTRKGQDAVLDREPCATCKEVLARGGIMIIEVEDGERQLRALKESMNEPPKRTGKVVGVMRSAFVEGTFAPNQHAAYIEASELKQLMGEDYDKDINRLVEDDNGETPTE
jgi:hypothetical protein